MHVQSMARALVAQALGYREFGVYLYRKKVYVWSTRCRKDLLGHTVVQGPLCRDHFTPGQCIRYRVFHSRNVDCMQSCLVLDEPEAQVPVCLYMTRLSCCLS